MVIAVYFAMAWLTNGCLTALQLRKLFNGTLPEPSWQLIRRQVLFMILATVAIVASLALQAFGKQMGLSLMMHTVARSLQGVAGALIYFHAFLVVPVAFEDHQKTFVLTAMSLLPGLATLTGPFLGAALYTYFGEHITFLVLMGFPAIAAIMLFSIRNLLPLEGTDDPEGNSFVQETAQKTQITGFKGFAPFADSAFIRALVCCCPPDMIRNAFAMMLPLFASVQGYSAFHTGLLPLILGSGLIISTCLLGLVWTDLSPRGKRLLGTSLMVSLGIVAQIMFHSYFFDQSRMLWYIVLFAFGALAAVGNLGSYHISDFADKQTYPVAFGVWNSIWVFSGVVGTMCAGFGKADDWGEQQAVMMGLGGSIICAGVLLTFV